MIKVSKINVIQMECWRRCCKVLIPNRVPNEEIRQRLELEANAVRMVKQKRDWNGTAMYEVVVTNRLKKITDWSPLWPKKRGRSS